MNLPKPLGNNVLVEIVNEYANVAGSGQSQKKGKLISANVNRYHITASSGIEFSEKYMVDKGNELRELVDKGAYVYWEEFANEGQQFDWNDVVIDEKGNETQVKKTYAFIAWWRLTGAETPEENR